MPAEVLDTLQETIEAVTTRRVAKLTRRRSAYESSFRLEELDVELEDGASLTLIFKDLGHGAMSSAAAAAKSGHRHDPMREIHVYENILSPAGLGPRFYGSVVDPAADRCWLFIEKVAGIELYQAGDLQSWQDAARWLARMHLSFRGCGERLLGSAPLLVHDSPSLSGLLEGLESSRRVEVRALASSLRPARDRLLGALLSTPPTLLHGDFYASNVLVRRGRGEGEIVPVDWEMAAVGPGLLDLAALTAGDWPEPRRRAIASAYREVAGDRDGSFWTAYECARLVLALQWLAAPSQWQPPSHHAHDWYRDALDTAPRLGIRVSQGGEP